MCYKSTAIRAKEVQEIVKKHYEPGRQDRCKLWVYRTIVAKQFGISQRTFFFYLSLNLDSQPEIHPRYQQLSLWS